MYLWVDGEQWAADGQPPLDEERGLLWGQDSSVVYGRVLSEEENRVVIRALLDVRLQEPLPLD